MCRVIRGPSFLWVGYSKVVLLYRDKNVVVAHLCLGLMKFFSEHFETLSVEAEYRFRVEFTVVPLKSVNCLVNYYNLHFALFLLLALFF